MALMMLCWQGSAGAWELPSLRGSMRFLSEIILPVGEVSRSTASSSASDARRKARKAVSNDDAPPPADPVLTPDGDAAEGVLLQRPSSGATDHRLRARARLQGAEQGDIPLQVAPIVAEPGSAEARRENMSRNIEKAQGYSGGGSGRGGKAGTFVSVGTAVGVPGPDGVLVVSCDTTSNAAGRIGNDDVSGSTFNLVLNGKLVRARCK